MSEGWTSARVARLEELWAKGSSCAQIAAELGGFEHCTDRGRSAVMGKIHRLKLPTPKDKIARRRQSYRGQETETARHTATPAGRNRNATRMQAKANGHDPAAQPRRNPSHNILAKIAIDASEPGLTENLKAEAPDGTGIKLIDLDASTCRWPKGDPLDVDFEFCGRRSPEDMPYCAHHSRIAYQPAAERRRQQPRV